MGRPDLPNGWLGAQPKFSELKIKTDSHESGDVQIKGQNEVTIRLKTGIPLKVVAKFTDVATEQDLPNYVFVQRKDKDFVQFRIGFKENGFYKFQIFALEENNESESLPNVYNYLLEVKDISKAALPFAKAYTKFYLDYCELVEPLSLNQHSKNLDQMKFAVYVPGAKKVAVHCVEEWFHLEKNGNLWEGKADLTKYKAKDSKVTVNASYDEENMSYSVLLEYHI